jgi:hypothetical protein
VQLASKRVFGFLVLAFAISIATPGGSGAGDVAAPKGAVILTISGAIEKSNRGTMRGKRDGFLNFHEVKFDKAFAFDRAMLAGLKQGSVTAQPPQFSAPAVFSGPYLSDVLAMVGAASGASIEAKALDGYVSELSAEDIAARDWILALSHDGKPFALGGLGPIWMMHKPSAVKVPEEEESTWPWALFYIKVKK